MIQIAINLIDLDRIEPLIRGMLLNNNIDDSGWVETDRSRLDESALVFTCDLLKAACICDTIRTKDRNIKRYPTRVYVCRAEAWIKLAGGDKLAIVQREKVVLNHKIFGAQAASTAFM